MNCGSARTTLPGSLSLSISTEVRSGPPSTNFASNVTMNDLTLIWATIVAQDPSSPEQPRYTLLVKVIRGRQKPYGRYELRLRVPSSGRQPSPPPETLLIVKPCVHVEHSPALHVKADQTAELTLSVANCGTFDCSVSVNVHHHGSQWSQQWSIELGADAGPFDLSEEITLPSGKRSAEFDLTVSAENLTIATYRLHGAVRFPSVKKAALAAGSVIVIGAGIAIGVTASGGSNPTRPSSADHEYHVQLANHEYHGQLGHR